MQLHTDFFPSPMDLSPKFALQLCFLFKFLAEPDLMFFLTSHFRQCYALSLSSHTLQEQRLKKHLYSRICKF